MVTKEVWMVVRKDTYDGHEYADSMTISCLQECALQEAKYWDAKLPHVAAENPVQRVAKFRVTEVAP